MFSHCTTSGIAQKYAAEKLTKFHILQSRVQRKIADVSPKTFKKFTDHFILELQNCIVKENDISPS